MAVLALALAAQGCGRCTRDASAAEVCVPGAVAARAPLELDGRATCASACEDEAPRCSVTVEGAVLHVDFTLRRCPLPPGQAACAAVCAQPRTVCAIPALEPGRYVLRTEEAEQQLVVQDGSTATACRF